MNFSPKVKSWLILISLVFGSGIGIGYTAFLSGASWQGASVCGLGVGLTNLYHALTESPKDKAAKAAQDSTASPFQTKTTP